MKKLCLSVLLLVFVSLTGKAQLKFYYYPLTNVYYDVAQERYLYQDNSNWTPVKVLPAKFKGVNGGPRYVVYTQTPDVWTGNRAHYKKYEADNRKNYSKGKAVGYKDSKPNRGVGVGHVKKAHGKH